MGSERPLMGSERPLMGFERPLMESERPLMGSERPLMGLERPLRLLKGLSQGRGEDIYMHARTDGKCPHCCTGHCSLRGCCPKGRS